MQTTIHCGSVRRPKACNGGVPHDNGSSPPRDPSIDQVLIGGAGPTGLALALWLTHFGVRVRVFDRATGPGTTSRALAEQSRTLELYRPLGLADAVVAAEHRAEAVNLSIDGEHHARVALGDIGQGLIPYPANYIFPQDQHERLLESPLQAMGVGVERRTELLDCEDLGDRVRARCQRAGEPPVSREARYLVGCDGASSTVRKVLGAGFEGGTYRQRFYVADIQGSGEALTGTSTLTSTRRTSSPSSAWTRAAARGWSGSSETIVSSRPKPARCASRTWPSARCMA